MACAQDAPRAPEAQGAGEEYAPVFSPKSNFPPEPKLPSAGMSKFSFKADGIRQHSERLALCRAWFFFFFL